MSVLVSKAATSHAQEELRAWSEVPDDLIDPGAAALAFAALRLPQLDSSLYREHMDRLAAEVAQMARSVRPSRVEQVAGILREVIALRHGYQGEAPEAETPESANLMRVIDRRRGLSVALGIIYIAAARANGWEAVGLDFPGHFLIRLEMAGRRLIIDPAARGEVVAVPHLRTLVKDKLGPQAELKPDYYLPLGNRDVLLRLQNALKARFVRVGLDEQVAEILEGMLLLAPDRAVVWREFGLTLARLGQEHRAIVALENYLTLSGDDPQRHQALALVEQLRVLIALPGA